MHALLSHTALTWAPAARALWENLRAVLPSAGVGVEAKHDRVIQRASGMAGASQALKG